MINGSAGIEKHVENAQFVQSSPVSIMSQYLVVINVHELQIIK